MNIIPSALLVEELARHRRHSHLHVGISHRSYLLNDGGIEHCLRRETEIARLNGVDYLHLCPPEAAAQDRRTPALVEVCLNDEFVGLTCLDGLSAKFSTLQPSMSFLHSALGFESGSLIRLLLNIRACGPIMQWIHDLSFACESVTLVRNGIACGVPVLDAKICDGCSFNSSRASVMAHYDQIERLSDCQVFPSLSAQSRYNSSISARGRASTIRQFVLPHYIVNCSTPPNLIRRVVPMDVPVGVAFFGHSVPHKGWLEFVQLVSSLYGNSAYNFYHIGTAGQTDPRIERINFSETFNAAGDNSLQDICANRNIRLAFFWPVALESFGIMFRQTLGAGCAIVCSENNDAQNEFINNCHQIRFFSRLDQLIAWLGDYKAVAELLNQAGKTECKLIPSACSYDLPVNQCGPWLNQEQLANNNFNADELKLLFPRKAYNL